MADDRTIGSDTLKLACAIVRRGDPEPLEWTARHPDWIRLDGTMRVEGGTAEAALKALRRG